MADSDNVMLEENRENDTSIEIQDNVHETVDGILTDMLPNYQVSTKRERRPTDFYGELANVAMTSIDPKTFKQAVKSDYAEHWKKVMTKNLLLSLNTKLGSW